MATIIEITTTIMSQRWPVVAIPGKGVRCQWGQFSMRASPYAPLNIDYNYNRDYGNYNRGYCNYNIDYGNYNRDYNNQKPLYPQDYAIHWPMAECYYPQPYPLQPHVTDSQQHTRPTCTNCNKILACKRKILV